ncbi:hypothetical protein ACFE04_013592 [Oxalis oulophora]
MTSSATTTTTNKTYIEHIVLLKVNDDQITFNNISNNLKNLTSIEHALHLTAGPIHRLRSSSPSSPEFTHILHGRYSSKDQLAAYADHPTHVSVVKLNQPSVEENMAVDWIAADGGDEFKLPVGSTLRVCLIKLKEESVEKVKIGILDYMKRKLNECGRQFSCGEDFNVRRAKGFTIAALVVFDGEDDDGLVDFDFDQCEFKECLDTVIVIDYVVPEM